MLLLVMLLLLVKTTNAIPPETLGQYPDSLRESMPILTGYSTMVEPFKSLLRIVRSDYLTNQTMFHQLEMLLLLKALLTIQIALEPHK